MIKLVLLGGGGHCHSVIDVIQLTRQYEILGILDSRLPKGHSVFGHEVLGGDELIKHYLNKDVLFVNAIGQIGVTESRIKLFRVVKQSGGTFATIVSPRAYVGINVRVGEGTIVMHDSLINANSIVGTNCIINSKSLIEHDCLVGDNCHISTGAILNGGVEVGDNCFIGSGSVCVQSAKIPKNSFIKAQSLYKGA
ncbi:acetyltransferase [Catenovulum agarivorans]|uniref:acetyltransferase n=1 Tax=Catenovulum agarivorans TaxID=1172192 RepID=UPI0002E2F9B7|nr:acetyltransferase [Catenovulum agarivorans]